MTRRRRRDKRGAGNGGDGSPAGDVDFNAADFNTVDLDAVDESERIPDEAPKHTFLWVLLAGWLLASESWLRSHGGPKLRWGLRTFWAFVAVAGLVLLMGPVINKPLTLDDITGSASNVTERWIARDFAVDYRITRTPEGMLVAQVEERISAMFPEETNERGIQRVLATQYQGHSLNPANIAATLDGEPIEVGRSASADQLTLTVEGAEVLKGDHEIVLSYELSDLAYQATDDASGRPVDMLEWDVFGPSWPQGLAGLDVQVTIPEEVDDNLIRPPRGSLAWTIVGGGEWLEPEPGGAGEVTYQFTNDQRIPPHAQAWFTMSFAPGTFTMPAPSPLFLLQSFGPLAPLAFLAITLLLAFAARAVAWSDARGRPWFVAQFAPPKGVTPRMAAQVLRAPEAMELAEAIAATRGSRRDSGKRRELLIAAVKVAKRTGRIGDRPRALTRYLAAAERRAQLKIGLRRVPAGFVRDLFIAAPVALTLVQWGLVRQLSHQAVLAVVWWPVAFVTASSVIAAIVLWVALSARPLTPEGALVKQHLLGMGVYAQRTQLLQRAEANEQVLPYAVLLERPRTAGRQVVELIEGELGEPGAAGRWHTLAFLTWPRLVVRALAVLLVAGVIATIAVLPAHDARSPRYLSYSGDVAGSTLATVESVDTTAELTRTAEGRARLDVSEQFAVTFSDGSWRVPQFVHQWPASRDGHDLDLNVTSLRIDGRAVPYVTERVNDTLVLRTTLVKVLSGTRDVRLAYTVESAATAAEQDGQLVDRVRWVALLDGWKYGYTWGDAEKLDPFRITLRVSEELADLAIAGGWISQDTTSAERASDWVDSVVPFGSVDPEDSRELTKSADGIRSHMLEPRMNEHGGWPLYLTLDDLGTSMDFPPGTFVGPDQGSLQGSRFVESIPLISVLILAALGFFLGAAGSLAGLVRLREVFRPGLFRDLVKWLAPAATLTAGILFVWVTADMPAGDSSLPAFGWSTLAAVVSCISGLALTSKRRLPL